MGARLAEKGVNGATVGMALALLTGAVAGGVWLSSRDGSDDQAPQVDMAQVMKD